MPINRADLRAYPRLTWAHPARMEIGGARQSAQVADLSQGGCKLLPSDLVSLLDAGLRPGAPLHIQIDHFAFDAVMRWATPNFSALGCSFDHVLTEDELRHLGVKVPQPA